MAKLARIAQSMRLATAIACALASAAHAQSDDVDEIVTPGGVLPAGAASTYNPGDQLAANLKLLAQNPRNVAALTQAGASALAAGDASAALGFLARADEINPSSPRIKQLLGSALIQLERPEDGLRLFAESAALGGLTREILRDRGLAFDLRGDPRRAQADYIEALKRGADDEVARRYALSLGATGDREQALRVLEPLIRKQDQAAWRARAFVMAMTGDLRSAERIVAEVMPPNLVGTLGNFMRRLPNLTPAQRAAAVNFGTMPAEGPQYALAAQTEALRPITGQAAQNLARPSAPIQTAAVATQPSNREKPSKRDRRRRGRDRETQVAVLQPSVALPPLAPASVNPRPGFTAPTPAPVQAAVVPKATPKPLVTDNRQGARVGQRVGPVDPALLPSEIRPTVPIAAVSATQPSPVAVPPQLNAQKPASVALPPVSTAAVVPQRPASVTLPSMAPQLQPVRATPVNPPPVLTPPNGSPVTQPPGVLAPVQVASAAPVGATAAPKPLFEIPSTRVDVAPNGAVQLAVTNPTPAVPSPSAPLARPLPAVTTPAVTTPSAVPPQAAANSPMVLPLAVPSQVSLTPSVLPPPVPPVQPSQGVTAAAISANSASTRTLAALPQPLSAAGPSLADAGLPSRPLEPAGAVQPSGSTITNAPPGSPIVTALPATSLVREVQLPAPGSTGLATPAASAGLTDLTTTPSVAVTQVTAAQAAPPLPEQPRGLADVIGAIETEEESRAGDILDDAEFRRARLAAKRKADAEEAAKLAKEKGKLEEESAAALKAKAKAAEEEEARQVAKRNPARVWVQIATGANRAGLPGTWGRLREKGGDVLKGKSAASVPFKSTNRLIVGPYKSQTEARAAVNKLAAKGIQATTFSSEAGEEVSAIGGR